MTVLFISNLKLNSGLGANKLFISHSGKVIRQMHPVTNMAMIFVLLHPVFSEAAKVNGINISENADVSNNIPMMSSSYHRHLRV
jgi:hypothetical protein